MTDKAIKQILNKFNITSVSQLEEQLEYYLNALDPHYDDCGDDPIDKDCTNSNCYEDFFVPDCRKLIEIYNKYFKKDITNRKHFIEYLVEYTNIKQSSIENYLYCRSCNQQIRKGTQASLKIPNSEFKKDFCKNLTIKFDYNSLFETEYISIKQFLNKEHQITSDTFIPIYNEEDKMTADEEKKLFDIVHTSKKEFQINLNNQDNFIGSDKYLFNLASYAFERGFTHEATRILDKLEKDSQNYSAKLEFLQLKAKLLSNQQKDTEAIIVLKKLISENKSNIDAETFNLLAASIKRDAFNEYEKYSDEKDLIEKLNEAKDIYYSVYKLSNDYYPALNYIYLQFMLAHINDDNLDTIINEAKTIWANTNHKITDWWSFISNIEYLILIGEYEDVKKELNSHFDELNKDEITEFNISSSVRQLNLYSEFCDNKELKEIIEFIQNINQ